MAKKKSPAELKAEGAELGTLLAAVRKRDHNFALLIGKDGLVLETHPKKGADILRRNAKAAGGGPKGAAGVMRIQGKVIELACEDDSAPGTLVKLAKKHFAERGLAYKIIMTTPSGAVEDEAEEEAQDTRKAEKKVDPDAEKRAQLQAKLEGLQPALDKYIQADPESGDKIAKAIKAAGAELQKTGLGMAEQVIAKLQKLADKPVPVKLEPKEEVAADDGPAEPQAPDSSAALTEALVDEFDAMQDQLNMALERAGKGGIKKLTHFAEVFASQIEAEDTKKAGQALAMIKKNVADMMAIVLPSGDAGAAVEPTEGLKEAFDKVRNVFKRIGRSFGRAAPSASPGTVPPAAAPAAAPTGPTPPPSLEGKDEEVLARLGVDPKDKAAVKAAKPVLKDVKKLGLPSRQFGNLLKLSKSDPKTYTATIDAMKAMDPSGKVDVSTEKLTAKLAEIQDERAKRDKEWVDYQAADKLLKAAVQAKAAADKALTDFQKTVPANLTTLPQAKQDEWAAKLKPLTDAATAAEADRVAKFNARGVIGSRWHAANNAITAKTAEHEALSDKRDLLDAVAFGSLSDSAKNPIAAEDKVKLIEAWAKDAGLGRTALDLADDADDPSLIINNVGAIAAKFEDGFADKTGKKLPATISDEDRSAMAQNALKIGASRGQEYFDGFAKYLESGDQLKPDPCGGLGVKLGEGSNTKLNEIGKARTKMMAQSAVGTDGKVNFDDPKAKDAMDHMLFHPGSLKTATPQILGEIDQVKGMFSDAGTKVVAQKVITDTKAPVGTSPQAVRGQKLIGDTLDKTGTVDDTDARAAVLSAMMTPLSQGPVGSCFSTAPVRAMRKTDPVAAMGELSKIASTGEYKTKANKRYPANTSAPGDENPLMRSWEYSVATAAANLASSQERKKLTNGILPDPPKTGATDLNNLKGIVGEDAWKGTGATAAGAPAVLGVKAKLQKAMTTQISFFYNSAPTTSDGSGDGSSTNGGYELQYKKKSILSEAEFVAAMKAIAMEVTGVAKGSTEEGEIDTLVGSAAFKASVLASAGVGKEYVPWNRLNGGYDMQTAEVLENKTFERKLSVGGNTSGKPEGARTREVLDAVMGSMGNMAGDMGMMSVYGGKNHTFNLLPNDPSLAAIKDPDSDKKIKSVLLDPGAAMAAEVLPADKAGRTFDAAMEAVAGSRGMDAHAALVKTAMEKRPSTDMTTAQLNAHIDTVTDDLQKAVAKAKSDAWKKKETDKGKTVSTTDYNAKLAEEEANAKAGVADSAMVALVENFDVPDVVIADTNWGGNGDQKYFVVAPSPVTGELKLWEKEMPSGKLTPAHADWANGQWVDVKPK